MSYDTNFRQKDGKIALVRCPKCHKENYALNVLSGICTWCRFDINKAERSNDEKHGDSTKSPGKDSKPQQSQ